MRKICRKCDTEKPIEEFVKNKQSKNGHRNECVVCYKKTQKKYRDKNIIKSSEYSKIYRVINSKSLKEYQKIFNQREDIKEKKREYSRSDKYKKHRRETREISIYDMWRSVIHSSLKRLGRPKENKTINLLGYSAIDLENHLENLFTEGMTWENHGEWHIDHIKPLNSFNENTSISIINALSNLQPLWATTREINGIIYEGNLNKGGIIKNN